MSEVKNYKYGKFNAGSGQVIDLREPTPEMIHPEDIIGGLSKICRFGGQIPCFYSVAQHSVLVEHYAPVHLKRAALLHDATEAYLGDVIKPLKHLLGESYGFMEEAFAKAIFTRFNEPIENLALVKQYDLDAYELEKEAFKYGNMIRWSQVWKKELEYLVAVWGPQYAGSRFKVHFENRFRKDL